MGFLTKGGGKRRIVIPQQAPNQNFYAYKSLKRHTKIKHSRYFKSSNDVTTYSKSGHNKQPERWSWLKKEKITT